MNFEKIYSKIEKTAGSMKFAVILILLFSLGMIIGTFFESWYGTDFAGRTIYKRFPFMLLQFLMIMSIIFATFIRLPFKKRLRGFYTIHTGLIMIGCGSFITWYAGIDGTLSLDPNTPARQVLLSQDVFKMHFRDANNQVTFKLPYTAFKTSLDEEYNSKIKLVDYFPFAEGELKWQPFKNVYSKSSSVHSSSYLLYNDNVSQDFILSLNPEAQEFESTLSMGLLNIHYLPAPIANCITKEGASKLLIWNAKTTECFTPEERNIEMQKTASDVRFFAFKDGDKVISFFPDMSPWALGDDLKPLRNSSYRVFSKKMFEQKPHLFLFGKKAAFYNKDLETPAWELKEFATTNGKISLPWMNFTLQLERHEDTLVPVYVPKSVLPIQSNSQLIKGTLRAVKINVKGEDYWVTNERPLRLLIDGEDVLFTVQKESLELPFEFTLTNFKMDKDPGTNNPASYESFVTVFTKDGPLKSHIYMNNPLKYAGFTFYQASYSQHPETGVYSSTLSVNVDQGRFLKYLGSILLVFGAMWHYYLTKREIKLGKEVQLFEVKK